MRGKRGQSTIYTVYTQIQTHHVHTTFIDLAYTVQMFSLFFTPLYTLYFDKVTLSLFAAYLLDKQSYFSSKF